MTTTPDTDIWVPPSLAARLVVGARVRVRLSGECVGNGDLVELGSPSIIGEVDGHLGAADGCTGTIIELLTEYPLHAYSVAWDEPVRAGRRMHVSESYAASELVPLDADESTP